MLPILKPMEVGSVPRGPAAGLAIYFLVRRAFTVYQTSRRRRLAECREARQAAPSAK